MSKQEFEARRQAAGEGSAWTLLTVPFSVEQVFGSRGRVAVKGTLNGFPYRSSLMPNGDGTHGMMVSKAMQQGAGAGQGDTVHVVMEPDTEPRAVTVPSDLQAALLQHAEAAALFEKLAYSHEKEYVDWIESAKRAETRASRVEKAVSMVVERKRVKG